MGKKLYKDGDRELYKLCAEVSNLEEVRGLNPVAPTRVFQKSLFISIFY